MKKNLGVWIVLFLLLLVGGLTEAQTHVAALLNTANTFTAVNTFLAGMTLPGSTTGSMVLTAPEVTPSVTYTLPSTGGAAGYGLCIGSAPGILAYCPPPGSGAGTATVTFTPSSISFGSVPSGTASPYQTVTITNTGTALLTFSGAPAFTFTGTNPTDFSQISTCGSSFLDAGWVCTVLVQFTPGAPGARSGTLNISDSAAGSPQLVTLTGTGS